VCQVAKVFWFFFSKKNILMRLTCPFCGPRGIEEFTYMGDATLQRPGKDAEPAAWVDYVYLRQNPAGAHSELWYHTAACRQFLTVHRDTRTHAISATGTT
jgi:sarcosine oxidase subunit delta